MKFNYFKIKDALDEARESFTSGSNGEKLASSAKLIGKSAANIGMAAVTVGAEVLKNAPAIADKIAKNHLEKNADKMTCEQRARAERVMQKRNLSKQNHVNQS